MAEPAEIIQTVVEESEKREAKGRLSSHFELLTFLLCIIVLLCISLSASWPDELRLGVLVGAFIVYAVSSTLTTLRR